MVNVLIAPVACSHGSTTNMSSAIPASAENSIARRPLEASVAFIGSALQTPAAGHKDACGLPLQEEDDQEQHEDFAEHGGVLTEVLQEIADIRNARETGRDRRQVLLKDLIDAADAVG